MPMTNDHVRRVTSGLSQVTDMTVYSAEHLDPDVSSWPTKLVRLADPKLQQLRESARRRLVESAKQYIARLSEPVCTGGLKYPPASPVNADPQTTPIIMTGHQPVIFHSGLTFKYEITEKFAVRNHLIAVAVVIDTDEGDAGEFRYPAVQVSEKGMTAHVRQDQNAAAARTELSPVTELPLMITASASFGQTTSLYAAGSLQPRVELQAVTSRVADSLITLGCLAEAERMQHFTAEYAQLQTRSMAEANLIVRRNAGIGGRMLELPLSEICGFPEVVAVTEEILARPVKFAQCYNDTLNVFRREHKIHNEANPFPNLQIEPDACELPFWVVDHRRGTRTILRVLNAGAVNPQAFTGPETQLVPRGALITAMLRLLFSDLFIHGTGGGRYDRYTDQLIRAWWHVDPPPIAVASASRYLFEKERTELSRLQRISEQLRDLQFNPQRHFGTGVFSSALEFTLQSLVQQKDAAVERMKQVRESGQPARDIGREIQHVGDEIKSRVAAEFEAPMARLRGLSDENIETLNSRTWPWFLFSGVAGDAAQRSPQRVP